MVCETDNRVSISSHRVWLPQRKTPQQAQEVKAYYADVLAISDLIRDRYRREVLAKMSQAEKQRIESAMNKLGLTVDFENCHVKYRPDFEPQKLDYNLTYCRHGKTEGNTEPRIFQGYCDYWENQLNEIGRQQAVEAADKTDACGTKFDLILCSPLGRAIQTGEAYFSRHPEIPVRIARLAGEQQFGDWDNQQLWHLPKDSFCHLFYVDQSVLVKSDRPHRDGEGVEYPAENFVELLEREARFLQSVNDEPEVRDAKARGSRANVLVYGHSMAGAAISMLMGHGKMIDATGALGFDGKYIMPNAQPTPLPPRRPRKQMAPLHGLDVAL